MVYNVFSIGGSMKEVFLNHTMNFIAANQKELTDEDKEKLAYGLEGIYLTITKMIIIFFRSLTV